MSVQRAKNYNSTVYRIFTIIITVALLFSAGDFTALTPSPVVVHRGLGTQTPPAVRTLLPFTYIRLQSSQAFV